MSDDKTTPVVVTQGGLSGIASGAICMIGAILLVWAMFGAPLIVQLRDFAKAAQERDDRHHAELVELLKQRIGHPAPGAHGETGQ